MYQLSVATPHIYRATSCLFVIKHLMCRVFVLKIYEPLVLVVVARKVVDSDQGVLFPELKV